MGKKKIFIIDDEIEICLHLQDIFNFEGCETGFATTAKEGLSMIEQNAFDLLLVDIKLGGMISGIDIIKGFREVPNRPKIIVISAIPLDTLMPLFLKENIRNLVDGFLDKPGGCDPEKLMIQVKSVLNQKG